MNLKLALVLSGIAIVLAGSGVGYLVARNNAKVAGATSATGAVRTEEGVGMRDEKTFRDSAKGKLEEGGLNGEGTHKLVRDGGPSQTVYLLSSVVDLSEFVGKTVEVWGETIKAQRAPWLMDVGLVKLQE